MKFVHKPYYQYPSVVRYALSSLVAPAVWLAAIAPASAQEFRVDGRIANRHAADVPYAITTPFPGQFRFEVRTGDQWSVDRKAGTGAERAELSLDKYPVHMDVRFRVSYEIGIEQGAPANSTWLVLGQWHATEDKGDAPSSPPLAFELSGDDLVVYTQSTSEPRHMKNPPPVERARVPGIARDRWHRIEYDVLFNPSHGDLAVRLDGKPVFAGEIPIGYADAVGPYFKFGIYRSKSPERFAVRFRNITIGVLPR